MPCCVFVSDRGSFTTMGYTVQFSCPFPPVLRHYLAPPLTTPPQRHKNLVLLPPQTRPARRPDDHSAHSVTLTDLGGPESFWGSFELA
ncbi:hypothetical protein PoB_007703100 [Plakobranchus ocellatus]|uniref:Uncharacterized protein n=1 Tax=Plakobranchus ocellatus TaxID=259542 RepID=A0AAV4E2D9_9GAST|nr:hypothetical protein PoB_007703100 [Plakobranchus ocellatus]